MHLVRAESVEVSATNTIRIPHAIYERLRLLATESEVSVSRLAGDLLERSLQDVPGWIKLRTIEREHLRASETEVE
jgi:hypothetical protein